MHAMHTTLVLGLGNELLADDGVGVIAARQLADELAGRADVVETAMHGLALLDYFIGYERAVLIDAIQTGRHPPGTVLDLDPADLRAVRAPTPHFAGLPEMLAVAEQLELDFPRQFRIVAVEIANALELGAAMTDAVAAALPEVLARVRAHLRAWGV